MQRVLIAYQALRHANEQQILSPNSNNTNQTV